MNADIVLSAKHFTVQRVCDGVFVAIAKEGMGALANAAFIDIGDSVVVFDSFNTQQAAAELLEVMRTLIPKPVSHLVNSHWHGDHVRGNQVFQDVAIVATETTRSVMEKTHPGRIERQKAGLDELRTHIHTLEQQLASTTVEAQRRTLAIQVSFLNEFAQSLPTLRLTLPNQTFRARWTLHGSKRTIQCIELGEGHTVSDSVVYIPEDKVCLAGDVVAVHNHMAVTDGDVAGWIAILDELATWPIDVVVPGHGPIGDSTWIGQAKEYLLDLLKAADQATAAEIEVPQKYRAWAASEVYGRNLKHLMNKGDNP